jgi:ATP dependent DNA ligase domain
VLDGELTEPWVDRRKRLEDLGSDLPASHVTLVAYTHDAAQLWTTWVAWGGEGIVLKDARAPYRPGLRSPDWLKLKQRYRLPVHVMAGQPELVQWGDSGWAARLELRYVHPLTRQRVAITVMVRISHPQAFDLRPGHRATVQCWGSCRTDGSGTPCGCARTRRSLLGSHARSPDARPVPSSAGRTTTSRRDLKVLA